MAIQVEGCDTATDSQPSAVRILVPDSRRFVAAIRPTRGQIGCPRMVVDDLWQPFGRPVGRSAVTNHAAQADRSEGIAVHCGGGMVD